MAELCGFWIQQEYLLFTGFTQIFVINITVQLGDRTKSLSKFIQHDFLFLASKEIFLLKTKLLTDAASCLLGIGIN